MFVCHGLWTHRRHRILEPHGRWHATIYKMTVRWMHESQGGKPNAWQGASITKMVYVFGQMMPVLCLHTLHTLQLAGPCLVPYLQQNINQLCPTKSGVS